MLDYSSIKPGDLVQSYDWFQDVWSEVEKTFSDFVTVYRRSKYGVPLASNGADLPPGSTPGTNIIWHRNIRRFCSIDQVNPKVNIITLKDCRICYGQKWCDGKLVIPAAT